MSKLFSHKLPCFSQYPLSGIRLVRELWVPLSHLKTKQISSQGATLLRTCHMSMRHSGIYRTSHFMSPLDKHNFKQEGACTMLTCLISTAANYEHTAGRPRLFGMRLSFERESTKVGMLSKQWTISYTCYQVDTCRYFTFQVLVLTHCTHTPYMNFQEGKSLFVRCLTRFRSNLSSWRTLSMLLSELQSRKIIWRLRWTSESNELRNNVTVPI